LDQRVTKWESLRAKLIETSLLTRGGVEFEIDWPSGMMERGKDRKAAGGMASQTVVSARDQLLGSG
jgi:hypothetical protein